MDFSQVPAGFGMALAQNEKALNAYAVMTPEQKNAVLEKAHRAASREQVRQLVAEIAAQA